MEFSLHVPAEPAAAGGVRLALRQRLEQRLTDEEHHDLALVVTELVANAVKHGSPPIRVDVAVTDGAVRAEVADGGAGFEAQVRKAGLEEVGGRGLWIVASIADRWGIFDGSSHVWFEIDRRSTREPDPGPPDLGPDERPPELPG